MSVYQGPGCYLVTVSYGRKTEAKIIGDERDFSGVVDRLPFLGFYSEDKEPAWFAESDLEAYLGPLIEPLVLPTTEELQNLSACYHGLGWYYARDRALCECIADLSERFNTEARCLVVVDDAGIGIALLNRDGSRSDDGIKGLDDLVYYVGKDKPEQSVYDEFYVANKPKIPIERWLVQYPSIATGATLERSFLSPVTAKEFAERNGGELILMREVPD